jgi:hypothetical protein
VDVVELVAVERPVEAITQTFEQGRYCLRRDGGAVDFPHVLRQAAALIRVVCERYHAGADKRSDACAIAHVQKGQDDLRGWRRKRDLVEVYIREQTPSGHTFSSDGGVIPLG